MCVCEKERGRGRGRKGGRKRKRERKIEKMGFELLKVPERELYEKVCGGLQAMELEIKMLGDAETIELFNYVLYEKTSENEYDNGIRDMGRLETCLTDFLAAYILKSPPSSDCIQ